MKRLKYDESGQMHTLEGIMSAGIMIMVMVFVVQGTSLTPLSSSSTNQHVQLELMNLGQDLLTTLDYNAGTNSISPLKKSILSWNGMEYVWDGSRYVDVASKSVIMNNDLTQTLNFALNGWGIAYDVEVIYIDFRGNVTSKKMIWNGNPSENSISVSKVVAIHNSDISRYNTKFGEQTGIPDLDTTTDFYNLLDVKLTLWRM